jgi:anti-sigma-K factor RskA
MNILERPELMDRLAAAYALGTLRGGARRRFETLARGSPALRVMAQAWQERFMSITELQPSEAPDPNVWKRIENIVAAEARPALAAAESATAELLRRARNWWRAGAIAAAAASVAAIAITLNLRGELQGRESELAQLQSQGLQLARRNTELMAELQAQPHVAYVAVLTDDKATPAMLAMFDHKHGTLMLKRMVSFQEGPEKSLQLWALPPSGAPRSMGVLGEQGVLQMAATAQTIGGSPALAISLEPKGGVSGESGPTGPVLWKGAVLRTPL